MIYFPIIETDTLKVWTRNFNINKSKGLFLETNKKVKKL